MNRTKCHLSRRGAVCWREPVANRDATRVMQLPVPECSVSPAPTPAVVGNWSCVHTGIAQAEMENVDVGKTRWRLDLAGALLYHVAARLIPLGRCYILHYSHFRPNDANTQHRSVDGLLACPRRCFLWLVPTSTSAGKISCSSVTSRCGEHP